MTLIAITCGMYAAPYRLIDALSALYQCAVYEDPALVKQTGQAQDLRTDLIFKSIQCRQIPFDNFTHDRKKCLAALKVQISQNILRGPCFSSGVLSHLIIESDSGHVLVTLDRKVMNLARVQKEIMDLAGAVPGVKSVKTKIGPNFYKGGVVRNLNLTTPFKRKT